MTNFSYNVGVPATNNNPSDDQPEMLINTQSIKNLIDVDHLSFGVNDGGTHKQVTIVSNNVPAAPTNPTAIFYTNTGDESLVSEAFFRNQKGIFNFSTLRAFGVFTTAIGGASVPLDMGMNVVDPIAKSSSVYTVSLTPGVVTGTTVAVFLNHSSDSVLSWTYALNTLTISQDSGIAVGRKISFAIFQA